ncbi:MAG: hypothetical protein ACE5HE_12335 [Phycisphaerae bacterium]
MTAMTLTYNIPDDKVDQWSGLLVRRLAAMAGITDPALIPDDAALAQRLAFVQTHVGNRLKELARQQHIDEQTGITQDVAGGEIDGIMITEGP